MDGITDSMDMSLSKPQDIMMNRKDTDNEIIMTDTMRKDSRRKRKAKKRKSI